MLKFLNLYSDQINLQKNYKYFVKTLNKTENANYQTFIKALENKEPEICANSMICLIKITTYLLKKQIDYLEKAFINEGGMRERMMKARVENRKK